MWALIICELKSQNNRLQKPTFTTAALSLGERVSGDGVFSSRRRTGEGLLPSAGRLGRPSIRISYSLPLPTNPVSVMVGQVTPHPARPG